MGRLSIVGEEAEEVAIPTYLLRNLGVNTDELWSPAQSTVFTSPSYLPAKVRQQRNEALARTNRSASLSIGALESGRAGGLDSTANNFEFNAGRVPQSMRKTSLPTTRRDRLESIPTSIPEDGIEPVRTTTGQYSDRRRYSTSSSMVDPFDTTPQPVSSQSSPNLRKESLPAVTYWQSRRQTLITMPMHRAMSTFQHAAQVARKSSIYYAYEAAKKKGQNFQRKRWVQIVFEITFYLILLSFIYFVLVGRPLWKGAVWWLYWVVDHKFVIRDGFTITISIAAFYSFTPLLIQFEKYPPPLAENHDPATDPKVRDTALLIPCYKSAQLIGNTLEAALKIFPPEQIFVIANGNSPTPLDNTEEVCRPYAVNHVWSPVGSKIVAQFVGCYAAKNFKNVLLIDDDCALPPNFPIVSERMTGNIKCLGYTIKSVGPNSSKGTLCQQAQDLEYKISGLQRALAGMVGSATFPHGAISLWDRAFLIKTFYKHPGFSVSEDWFFGHVARLLGSRISMCTSVFVETETPSSVFLSGGGARGGFGEMTIFQQRFKRWNFFFVNGMWYNMSYIIGSWKLGWLEFGTKIFVFQEVYETLLYLLTPFILPISLIVRPAFAGYLLLGTVGMYLANVIIFNEIHLRRKNERVGFVATYIYYMPYKIILTAINVVSCYWAIYRYAGYFAKRHSKVVDDEHAVEVVLRLEEDSSAKGAMAGRRMTVTAIETRVNMDDSIKPQERGRLASYVSFMERISEDAGQLDSSNMSGGLRISLSEKESVDEPGSPKIAEPAMSYAPDAQTLTNVTTNPRVIDFADPFYRRGPLKPVRTVTDGSLSPSHSRKASMAMSMV